MTRRRLIFISVLALSVLIAVGLALVAPFVVNFRFKPKRPAAAADLVPVPVWHKKMTDICGQLEGLGPEAVIERFKEQGIVAQIGYGERRINVCGIQRESVKHALASSAGQGQRVGPFMREVWVSVDPIGEAFVAVVETGSFGDTKRSIVEFCDGSTPSVRDVEPR